MVCISCKHSSETIIYVVGDAHETKKRHIHWGVGSVKVHLRLGHSIYKVITLIEVQLDGHVNKLCI